MSTPSEFRYSFKSCPAFGGGVLSPVFLMLYSFAFSDRLTVVQVLTSCMSCSKFPSTELGQWDRFCLLGASMTLSFASSTVSKHPPISAVFEPRTMFFGLNEGLHHFFSMSFPHFFLNFLFCSRFFFPFFCR